MEINFKSPQRNQPLSCGEITEKMLARGLKNVIQVDRSLGDPFQCLSGKESIVFTTSTQSGGETALELASVDVSGTAVSSEGLCCLMDNMFVRPCFEGCLKRRHLKRTVRASCCGMTGEPLKVFLGALFGGVSFFCQECTSSGLEELTMGIDLSYNGIDDEDVTLLVSYLQNERVGSPMVEVELDLRGNSFGSKGLEQLLDRDTSLSSLDISYGACCVDFASREVLFDSILTNRTLRYLFLGGMVENCLTSADCERLIGMAKFNAYKAGGVDVSAHANGAASQVEDFAASPSRLTFHVSPARRVNPLRELSDVAVCTPYVVVKPCSHRNAMDKLADEARSTIETPRKKRTKKIIRKKMLRNEENIPPSSLIQKGLQKSHLLSQKKKAFHFFSCPPPDRNVVATRDIRSLRL